MSLFVPTIEQSAVYAERILLQDRPIPNGIDNIPGSILSQPSEKIFSKFDVSAFREDRLELGVRRLKKAERRIVSVVDNLDVFHGQKLEFAAYLLNTHMLGHCGC